MEKIYKDIVGIFVLILCLNFIVDLASADGIIIPTPHPDIQQIPPLSIKYHHVNVTIDNQYARTEIDQVFENEFNRDLEGTYIFPLPEDASISEFSMFVDNEKLEGRILEKDKAREIYEDIVRQLRDPALLEYTERNTFTAKVYPIPANGEKRIQLSYSEILRCDNGICKYTYPLETEKFSSKPLKDVVISVKLKSKEAIKAIYSPTHKISIKRIGDYEAEVSYEENNVKPDRDFVLYWTVSEEDFGVNLLAYRKKGDDGFFILMLSPKQEISKEEILPKDIVFVLDTSGSMSGKKIEQAKNALKFIVNNLNENDRFNIITFNTEIKKYNEQLIHVSRFSEGWEKMLDFIDNIDASGGTNIHNALLDSLKLFDDKDSNSTKIIVFLTDGLPTVGITETSKILNDIKSENKNNAKIFSFGVGYDVNTHLLDKISVQNSGASEYVEPDEDIEVKVSEFYSKINNPVLSDVKLDFNGLIRDQRSRSSEDKVLGLKVYDVYPKEIPDLFKGSQIVVFGRYSGDGNKTIKLNGKFLNTNESYSYSLDFPREDLKNEFIPKLWASRKIGYLLDEIRLNGENKEVIDEIINLSLRYGIMTPYTSFLVDIDFKERETARNMFNTIAMKSFSQTTGASAVRTAQSMQEMQKSGISQDGSEKVKSIGIKTFYYRNGIWIDNEYADDAKAMDLNYGSDEYFKIIAKNPEFGKYLSLGKNVKFCSEGRCFNIRRSAEIPTTTIPGIPIDKNQILVQTIAIIGIIILISLGILLWSRRVK